MVDIKEFVPSSPSEVAGKSNIKDTQISDVRNINKNTNEVDIDLKRLQETNRHEIDMMKYGWFGKIFGAEENSSKALTFSLVFFILVVWLALTIFNIWFPTTIEPSIELFKEITPIITLAFGYFFGKK